MVMMFVPVSIPVAVLIRQVVVPVVMVVATMVPGQLVLPGTIAILIVPMVLFLVVIPTTNLLWLL